jgi:hypothetical protein
MREFEPAWKRSRQGTGKNEKDEEGEGERDKKAYERIAKFYYCVL